MSDNFEVLDLRCDGPDLVATVRVTHVIRLSGDAARHLGITLVRMTDPKPLQVDDELDG